MRRAVELIANIAIILVCGLLCWTFFTHKGLVRGASVGEAGVPSLEGLALPALPGYSWGSHSQTLVLGIRKGCHFCEESLPFYKRRSELEHSNGLHAHRLAVMPDDKDAGTRYLQTGGVAVEGVFSEPPDSIKISGTPTLLLLDSRGRIARAWVGEQSSQGEEEVIAAVNAAHIEQRPWYRLW